MKSRNYYLDKILENLTGESFTGIKNKNYYLKKIYEHYGGDVEGNRRTSTYYLDKILEILTGEEVDGIRTENYYYKKIYEYFGGDEESIRRTDNYYLRFIAEATESEKTSSTISLTGSSITYGESLILTGTLSVGSGESVKIYQSNTLIDTLTTGDEGAFTKTVTGLNVGTYTFKAVYGGNETYASSISSNLNITVSKLSTNLTINVPALIYSDIFDVTGILTDENDTAIDDATVTLTWNDGSSHTETATTNSNGEVTFHRSAPTTITEYSFQLSYSGASIYENTSSSTVAKTPSKETTVMNLTSPLNNATFTDEDTITIQGSLVTDDGEELDGKSIKVKESGTTLTTLTTGSNGEFTGILTGFTVDTHNLIIEFETDSYYTTSSVNRTIIVNSASTPTTLSVSATKDILSYADMESSTLTATVLDQNNNAMSGESVAFKNGSTVLDIVTTDANGQASYTYTSQGVGDVTLTIECNLLQETYTVSDYIFVPTLDSNRQFYQMSGTTTISNGEMSSGSAKLLPSFDNSGNWELTFKVKFSGNNCCALLIPSTETSRDTNELLVTAYENAISWYNNGTITQNLQGHNLSANTYYNVTITKNGSSISVSIGNNSKTTTAWNSVSASNLQIGVGGWGTSGNVCTIKEIVVKPL